MKQTAFIILLALLTGLGSCKKFLDVKPEDSVEQDVLYSSEAGFLQHLNGIYLALADQSLYGGQLTMEMLEILAQRYNLSVTNHKFYDLGQYNYTSIKVTPKFARAWNGLYKAIGNVNTMLEQAELHKDLFTGINYDLIKGEGLGLRAFLHFDALRIFGPVYKTDTTNLQLIPYYTAKSSVQNPLLTLPEVVEKVIADLKEAETYLQNDPVIQFGKKGGGTVFTTARQLRMNYYAVKLLQARVYLYVNRKEEALAAAKAVIEKQPLWFPSVIAAEVTSTVGPDRNFSKELVFAVQDLKIKDKYEEYFNASQTETNILAPIQSRLEKVYESISNDLRYYPQIWAVPSDGTKTYKCFYKYAPMSDTALRKYSIPLMRVSESYLIAAEASSVLADKFQYLNTARAARNLTALATTTAATFTTELTKEYQKEFYGEGQLFFYYKRNNTASIDNGSAASGTVAMSNDKYIIPLPSSETSSRN